MLNIIAAILVVGAALYVLSWWATRYYTFKKQTIADKVVSKPVPGPVSGSVNLNAGETHYFQFLYVQLYKSEENENEDIVAGPFVLAENLHLDRGPYKIKIRVTGHDIPPSMCFLYFGVDSNGEVNFREWLEGKDTLEPESLKVMPAA